MPSNPRDLEYDAHRTQVASDVDTFMGYGVNEFTSVEAYGIFNDPTTFVIGESVNTEALRERLFDTPLMEDDNLLRVQAHANLTNEERAHHGQAERVVIRRQVRLETPWTDL